MRGRLLMAAVLGLGLPLSAFGQQPQTPPTTPPGPAPKAPSAQPPSNQPPPAQPLSGQTPNAPTLRELLAAGQRALDAARARPNTPEAAIALREAQRCADAAIERDPASVDARLLGADVLMEANQYDRARDYYRAVLEAEPGNYRANLGCGKIMVASSYWRQAVSYFERAEATAAEAAQRLEIKRLLAPTYMRIGETTKALKAIDEAVQQAPDDLDTLATAVAIRMDVAKKSKPVDMKGLEGALQTADRLLNACQKAVETAPWERERLLKLDSAYELQLTILREIHQLYYRRNARDEPTDEVLPEMQPLAAAALDRIGRIVRERALLHLTLSDHDALVALERAVQYDPRNVRYREHLADVYRAIRDQSRAVAECQRILELDPQHEAAKRYLESVGAPLTNPNAGGESAAPGTPTASGTPTAPGASPPTTQPAPTPPAAPIAPAPAAQPATQPAAPPSTQPTPPTTQPIELLPKRPTSQPS